MKVNRKNILIYLMTMFIMISLFHEKNTDTRETYCEDEALYELYSSYDKGCIYVCNSENNISNVKKICNDNDVIIIDELEYKDPNIKVISSYKITEKEDIKQILNIIKEYCSSKNQLWNRSIESMYNEWIVHNLCSSLSINKQRTDDVDLNNADENLYKSKIITKILGN